MYTILIIDDDIQIGNMEQEVLSKAGYNCLRAYSGTEALLILKNEKPDLIILDLMLPGLSGEEILPKLNGIPTIVVSAKVEIDDKISLLRGGALDYITKPFDIRELLARIEVQLRHNNSEQTSKVIEYKDLKLNVDMHMVNVEDKQVSLTKTEYAILKILMLNPNQVIAKSVILDRISVDTPDCTESSLKTHMSHLRSKLRDMTGKEYIESVWGIGFKMAD